MSLRPGNWSLMSEYTQQPLASNWGTLPRSLSSVLSLCSFLSPSDAQKTSNLLFESHDLVVGDVALLLCVKDPLPLPPVQRSLSILLH
jgi:hypothetical protein